MKIRIEDIEDQNLYNITVSHKDIQATLMVHIEDDKKDMTMEELEDVLSSNLDDKVSVMSISKIVERITIE